MRRDRHVAESQSGLSAGSGSVSNTSRLAPAACRRRAPPRCRPPPAAAAAGIDEDRRRRAGRPAAALQQLVGRSGPSSPASAAAARRGCRCRQERRRARPRRGTIATPGMRFCARPAPAVDPEAAASSTLRRARPITPRPMMPTDVDLPGAGGRLVPDRSALLGARRACPAQVMSAPATRRIRSCAPSGHRSTMRTIGTSGSRVSAKCGRRRRRARRSPRRPGSRSSVPGRGFQARA